MISVEQWQLISFFEVDPVFPDHDDVPGYQTHVFRSDRGLWHIEFVFNPGYRDVSFVIQRDDILLYEFSALAVFDITYNDAQGRETLEILLTRRESISLCLHPVLTISHHRTGTREQQVNDWD